MELISRVIILKKALDEGKYSVLPTSSGNISIDDIKVKDTDKAVAYMKLLASKKLSLYRKPNIYKAELDPYDVLVKINSYNAVSDILKQESEPNNESYFSYLFSVYVLERQTTHLLLPIVNFDSKSDVIKNYIKDKTSETVCVHIREMYSTYDGNYKSDIKSLLFQVFYTLALIQKDYPSFQHNNLKLSSLFISKCQYETVKYHGFYNDTFLLKSNLHVKIGNFETSTITEKYNSFYDIHTLISDIKVDDRDFLNFANKYTNKQSPFEQITSPIEIIYDPYFNNYLVSPENRVLIKDNVENKTSKFFRSELLNNSLKGGSLINKRIINPYKQITNDPSITNQEISAQQQHADDKEIVPSGTYDSTKGKGKGKGKDKQSTDTTQKESKEVLRESNGKVYSIPQEAIDALMQPSIITKPEAIYNVTTANPLHSYAAINRIYEDILPGDPLVYSYITTFERLNLINHIRNSLLATQDGEDITGNGHMQSLLSYIKVLGLNPYVGSYSNPIKRLPKGFIIYKSAYPIRYKESSIHIPKESLGINIKIYRMEEDSLKVRSSSDKLDSEKFNCWRDIIYYDWVKNKILRNKVAPNFVAPILYKIDKTSKYDWEDLERIRKTTAYSKLNPSPGSLVLLTESPNTNLLQWCSPKYESYGGGINKMTSTGYHSPEVWMSVLFQIVYAFSVLQTYNIHIRNCSIESTVYIKDIQNTLNTITPNCWIYEDSEITYNVPNYGYLVLIDPMYNETDSEDTKKIIGSIYSDNDGIPRDNIKSLIKESFNSIIDPDNFRFKLKVLGGAEPDSEIIAFLTLLYKDKSIEINELLFNYFKCFLNPRIGTALTKSELETVTTASKDMTSTGIGPISISTSELVKGKLYPRQIKYNLYEWVMYYGRPVVPSINPSDTSRYIICPEQSIIYPWSSEEIFKIKALALRGDVNAQNAITTVNAMKNYIILPKHSFISAKHRGKMPITDIIFPLKLQYNTAIYISNNDNEVKNVFVFGCEIIVFFPKSDNTIDTENQTCVDDPTIDSMFKTVVHGIDIPTERNAIALKKINNSNIIPGTPASGYDTNKSHLDQFIITTVVDDDDKTAVTNNDVISYGISKVLIVRKLAIDFNYESEREAIIKKEMDIKRLMVASSKTTDSKELETYIMNYHRELRAKNNSIFTMEQVPESSLYSYARSEPEPLYQIYERYNLANTV
jgi:hypothetical protein